MLFEDTQRRSGSTSAHLFRHCGARARRSQSRGGRLAHRPTGTRTHPRRTTAPMSPPTTPVARTTARHRATPSTLAAMPASSASGPTPGCTCEALDPRPTGTSNASATRCWRRQANHVQVAASAAMLPRPPILRGGDDPRRPGDRRGSPHVTFACTVVEDCMDRGIRRVPCHLDRATPTRHACSSPSPTTSERSRGRFASSGSRSARG